jgi:8-oxo-dGTP pyrophosphatase MutT (NUDIX family)
VVYNGVIKEKKAVVGFPVTKKNVLLAIKQRGNIGRGLYMPYGGKLERGETFEEAMVREFFQESGMSTVTDDLEEVGVLFTQNHLNGRPAVEWEIRIYLIHGWDGVPVDTDEMRSPRWFPRSKYKLPLARMLPADCIWVPKVLAGKYVEVYTAYDCTPEGVMTLRRSVGVRQTTRLPRRR